MSDSDAEKEKILSELEVIGRCKQCSRPLTLANEVTGPTGHFCGAVCKEKHEAFTRRAHALDMQDRSLGSGLVRSLTRLLTRLVVLAVVLAVLGAVGVYFKVPVLNDVAQYVLNALGL
jgi:hypothetical protein